MQIYANDTNTIPQTFPEAAIYLNVGCPGLPHQGRLAQQLLLSPGQPEVRTPPGGQASVDADSLASHEAK